VEKSEKQEDEKIIEAIKRDASPADGVPDHHLVVARLTSDAMKDPKLKDILGPLKCVINVALPLVEVPPLIKHVICWFRNSRTQLTSST
jgi:ATP-dependent Lon protease